jgi:hypothetical protein
MIYAERDRHGDSYRNRTNAEQADPDKLVRSRPEGLDDTGEYGGRTINPQFFDKAVNGRQKKRQNYPDIYMQTAQALFNDGFSPHDVARILDVSPRTVAVWIDKQSSEA